MFVNALEVLDSRVKITKPCPFQTLYFSLPFQIMVWYEWLRPVSSSRPAPVGSRGGGRPQHSRDVIHPLRNHHGRPRPHLLVPHASSRPLRLLRSLRSLGSTRVARS